MGEYDVLQRTGDGMFNATDLLRQWNIANPNNQRRLDKFWEGTHLNELMSEIAENELNFKSPNFGDLKNALSRTVRGKYNGGTFMHPFLFIKFAMYLSPRFEYQVIKFVYDKLIENRHLAGDNYNKLTAQVVKFTDVDYSHLAKGLNYIVFGKHYKGIRDSATTEQLTALHLLEEKLAFAIQMGYITNFDNLISEMQRIYIDNMKKPF